MNNPMPINAREVYQLLKDAAIGSRDWRLIKREPQSDSSQQLATVEIDSWQLKLLIDAGHLAHCQHCTAADGRHASLESWQRHGTDPLEFLSVWERTQLERLLTPDSTL
ncbi:hypothetical protein [Pseudomonas sp.]|uniref:DUF7693 family protein n=1 Tax=Pseudomonas sp. TaxID=306 RepID=UPI00257AF931|nr:hypothetical protein [Pseudomonas sp.]